jgi:ElaB/YqjD/DUF883 family membrane-anchored ribosome-binding protein
MDQVRNDTTSQSAGLMDKLRNGASSQLGAQKDRATDGLTTVAQAVRQSTQQLRDNKHEVIAGYVEQAVDRVERIADQLKHKDVGELVRDAQQFARRNPAVFVGAAFGVGIVAARFLKSSSRSGAGASASTSSDGAWRERTSGAGGSYGTAAPSYRRENGDFSPSGLPVPSTEQF